jgi:CheY-like chemotaxis protein
MSKVLLIEDDPVVANIYRNKLSAEGFEVEIAPDGEAGMEMVSRCRPDVVILDLMMPKIPGAEVMRTIRAQPEFQDLPLIVISNNYFTNKAQEAWKLGATKCLSKASCTPKQVVQVLRKVLPKSGAPGIAPAPPVPARAPGARPSAPRATVSSSPPVADLSEAEAASQGELQGAFIHSLPSTLATLRSLLQSVTKSQTEPARLKQLQEMYRRVHALTGNAGVAGLSQIAQMADALEALVKELFEKPRHITASTLRTLASAIDLLGVLFERGVRPNHQQIAAANILVVDDEAISRRAVSFALEKAKLRSIAVEDPHAAFNLLSENAFDLVFLDINMPGMNGFELCTKLRELPAHKKTPVVFVTSLNDFESRASSSISGGNDFIAKPFIYIELAVKALVYILRSRLQAAK